MLLLVKIFELLPNWSFEEASNNSRHILTIVSFEYFPFDKWISRFKTSCSLLSSITPLVLSLSFPIEVTIFDLRSIRSTILLSKSFIWSLLALKWLIFCINSGLISCSKLTGFAHKKNETHTNKKCLNGWQFLREG